MLTSFFSCARRLGGHVLVRGLCLGFFLLPMSSSWGSDLPPDAEKWLEDLRAEALLTGISPTTFDAALGHWRPLPAAIEHDKTQKENIQLFGDYLESVASPERVQEAQRLWKVHHDFLERLQKRFGVPPHILLALWAVESDFGRRVGDFPVFDALATLAWQGRRRALFQRQIFAALRLVERQWVSLEDFRGGWAGAIGPFQFMPATYLAYGLDFDGDHKPDLQHSLVDAFASAANYLQAEGWDPVYRWGREVLIPENFDWTHVDQTKTLTDWQRLGLKRSNGRNVSSGDVQAQLVAPQGIHGPLFLLYHNYGVLFRWNHSLHFAVAVGHLADRIAGGPVLLGLPEEHVKTLTVDELVVLQQKLAEAGYNPGKIDGFLGPKTRDAVRRAQKAFDLAPDGFPDHQLLHLLSDLSSDANDDLPNDRDLQSTRALPSES